MPDWEPISSSECVEGDCSSQVPDNWSYYRSMGTFNSDTIPVGRNTISISNEHYKGVSGKAFTVWTESAPTWSADGLLMRSLGAEYNEVYVKFWHKLQPGWLMDDDEDGILKIFRVLHYDGTGNIFQFFSTGNSCPVYVIDWKLSPTWGWRHVHSFRCAPQDKYYYCNPDMDYDPRFSGDFNSPGQLGDGEWHLIELHLKMNTPPTSGTEWNRDGIFQFWFDSVLQTEKTDRQYIVEGPAKGWNYIGIGGNQHNVFTDETSGDEQWYAIDDIVVSTEPIPGDYVIGGNQIHADVDNNSIINTTDAMLTLRNSLGLSMSGTNWFSSATTGDVNCDNVSNSTDAMLILRHGLGLSMIGTEWCED